MVYLGRLAARSVASAARGESRSGVSVYMFHRRPDSYQTKSDTFEHSKVSLTVCSQSARLKHLPQIIDRGGLARCFKSGEISQRFVFFAADAALAEMLHQSRHPAGGIFVGELEFDIL